MPAERAHPSGSFRGVAARARSLFTSFAQPSNALPLILLAAFVARGLWLDQPPGALIFDEAYYVNAGRVILGWPVGADMPYADSTAGLDPNLEHPPLGKVLIAGSMLVFGDTALGWRLPSLVAGMLALAAFYLALRASRASAGTALLALGFLAFDNLAIVHSRIGTLDMMALAPMLIGAWLALRRRWALAGVAMAVAFLVRITALFGLLAILLWLAWEAWTQWRSDGPLPWEASRAVAVLLGSFAVVALGGLWLLDLRFSSFDNPLAHIGHMVSYGANLTEPVDRSGICVSASSAPWQWLFNECQINYLRVDVTVTYNGALQREATIDFRGALNPVLASAIPIASLATLWIARSAHATLARWSVIWAAASFLPYLYLSLVNHRVTYIFYFLPVVPAIAAMAALLLTRSGLPRFVAWGFVAAYLVGVAAYYPFRQIP